MKRLAGKTDRSGLWAEIDSCLQALYPLCEPGNPKGIELEPAHQPALSKLLDHNIGMLYPATEFRVPNQTFNQECNI